MLGTLIIGPPGQPGKALLFENDADVGRTEVVALVLEPALNVVDGEVLFTRPDDVLADRIGFGGRLGASGRAQEEGLGGMLAEVVNQDAETPRGIAEAPGDFLGGELLDEVGAEGFVLTVGGIGGAEKDLRQIG